MIGRATNGGYGWRCGKSLALAMVKPDYAALGSSLEIKILGEIFATRVIVESPYDTDNLKLRA
jgi:dimethylglycine dehydrogenase